MAVLLRWQTTRRLICLCLCVCWQNVVASPQLHTSNMQASDRVIGTLNIIQFLICPIYTWSLQFVWSWFGECIDCHKHAGANSRVIWGQRSECLRQASQAALRGTCALRVMSWWADEHRVDMFSLLAMISAAFCWLGCMLWVWVKTVECTVLSTNFWVHTQLVLPVHCI